MKVALAAAALASLLLASGRAHAQASDDPTEVASIPVGRCMEVPMSLALAIAEREASRFLPPSAVMSVARSLPTPAAPAHAGRAPGTPARPPARPTVQLCRGPGDTGCRVSAPPAGQTRIQIETGHHGFVALPTVAILVPPPAVALAEWTPVSPEGSARPAHAPAPWRPPAPAAALR